jgi:protein arginine kinase activator
VKCQLCGANEASIHYIEIVEGQKTNQWICTACAEKEGITPVEVSPLIHGTLGSFLGEMLKGPVAGPTREKSEDTPVCDTCGYDFGSLQENSQLGCPACYQAFRQQLLPMLRRYHGGISHLGKLPRSQGPRAALRRESTRLKELLEQAVAAENYEEAAKLRDSIRDLEQQVQQAETDTASGSLTEVGDPEPEPKRDDPSDQG